MEILDKYNLTEKSKDRLNEYLIFKMQTKNLRGLVGECSSTYYNLLIKSDDSRQALRFCEDLVKIISRPEDVYITDEEKALDNLKDFVEDIEGKTTIVITDCKERPKDNVDAPTGRARDDLQKAIERYDLLWNYITEVSKESGNVNIIAVADSDTYKHTFMRNSELYHRILGHHITITAWTANQVYEMCLDKLKNSSFKTTPEFIENLKEYFFAVYDTADLQGMEFVEDLMVRLSAYFFCKPRLDMCLTVDSIPRYRKNHKTVEEIMSEMDDLVGLKEVKDQLTKIYENIVVNANANENNNYHMLFMGNPGTGKTTVAQMLADMFNAMGIIKTNKMVEVKANDLVSGYKGLTAEKANEKIKEAYNGVLFIDEAYTLLACDGKGDDVVPLLLKAAEEQADRLIIIMAGYAKEMQELIKSNPGIKSRFRREIYFPDYKTDELVKIFEGFCRKGGFVLEDSARPLLEECIEGRKSMEYFGNGREVRNIYNQLIEEWTANVYAVMKDNSDYVADRIITEELIKQILPEKNREALDDMIGLENIKTNIKKFEKQVKFTKYIKEKGLNDMPSFNMHMIFTGNPGTGKTTVAGHIADVLYSIGVLKTNKVTILERKDLVAGYIGQSENKTDDALKKGYGGVIFIDEAYSLAVNDDDKRDFASHVIEILLTAMESHKDDTVFIFAGYVDKMQDFLKSNPGLSSRIGFTFHFEDYSTEELTEMYKRKLTKIGFNISEEALEKVSDVMEYFQTMQDFGNGRFVDQIVQQTIIRRSERSYSKSFRDITKRDIPEIKTIIETASGIDSMYDPSLLSEESRRRTAIHEVGHAVAAYNAGITIEKVSVKSQIGSYGRVSYKNKEGSMTEKECMDRLVMLLSGRNAERVILGSNATGCSNDFERAKNLASLMVDSFAMGEIGITTSGDFLREADKQSMELLRKYSRKIEKVADELLTGKSFTGKEFIKELKSKN